MSNQDVCERFIAALSSGDWSEMERILHPEFRCLEADGLPYAGLYEGFAGWRRLSDAVLSTWSGFRIQLLEMHVATDNTATMRFSLSGKSRKTGRAWETSVLELWKFIDGRLASIDPYYFDTHLLAKADAE